MNFCGHLAAGAIQVTGVYSEATRTSQPSMLLGGRVQGNVKLLEALTIQPFIDVLAVLTRVTFYSTPTGVNAPPRTAIWVTWPVAITAGVAVGYDFL